ncbi:hypothetical protein KUTeg_023087 [Tegillarca granosa]|uniref:Uncharacterized protein n=1 Tax=Tegillarca granosa TaxID=220873 RepID=A0ABQ9E572_TEGGR|nr:hypothetical protein KUTeg_023087 [Tegillarca granosa]
MLIRLILLSLSIVLTNGRQKYLKGCRGYLDVVFVIDASDSIKEQDFNTVRNSVANLIYNLNIGGPPGTLGGNNDARAGFVVYSSNVSSQFDLSSDRYALVHAAHNFKHARDGTNTRLGIRAMRKMFQRNHRDNTHKVGMIITDGISKNTTQAVKEAEIARNIGIDLFAIGVTDDIATVELESIAGEKGRVLYVEDYDQLAKELEMLDFYKIVCPTTSSTSATTTTTTTTSIPITTTSTTNNPINRKPFLWTTSPVQYVTPNLPRGLCDHCTTRDGFGYNPHPTDCTKFIQCYFGVDGEIIVSEKQCSFGQFWSRNAVTCVSSQHVDCPTDKCKLEGLVAYPDYNTKNCREYWKCIKGQSYGFCCPPGEAFFPYLGCVKDKSCRDLCQGETRKKPYTQNKDKTKQAYINDENVIDIKKITEVETPCFSKRDTR